MLPYAGGILDQPESLMQIFDWIDAEVSAYRRQEAETARLRAEADEYARSLSRGH